MKIITLDEVKKWLEDNNLAIDMDDNRIEECHNVITRSKIRVNNPDKKWVACSDDSEVKIAIDAITKILATVDEDLNLHDVAKSVCEIFDDISHKPRMPFYVVMLDLLLV